MGVSKIRFGYDCNPCISGKLTSPRKTVGRVLNDETDNVIFADFSESAEVALAAA